MFYKKTNPLEKRKENLKKAIYVDSIFFPK